MAAAVETTNSLKAAPSAPTELFAEQEYAPPSEGNTGDMVSCAAETSSPVLVRRRPTEIRSSSAFEMTLPSRANTKTGSGVAEAEQRTENSPPSLTLKNRCTGERRGGLRMRMRRRATCGVP